MRIYCHSDCAVALAPYQALQPVRAVRRHPLPPQLLTVHKRRELRPPPGLRQVTLRGHGAHTQPAHEGPEARVQGPLPASRAARGPVCAVLPHLLQQGVPEPDRVHEVHGHDGVLQRRGAVGRPDPGAREDPEQPLLRHDPELRPPAGAPDRRHERRGAADAAEPVPGAVLLREPLPARVRPAAADAAGAEHGRRRGQDRGARRERDGRRAPSAGRLRRRAVVQPGLPVLPLLLGRGEPVRARVRGRHAGRAGHRAARRLHAGVDLPRGGGLRHAAPVRRGALRAGELPQVITRTRPATPRSTPPCWTAPARRPAAPRWPRCTASCRSPGCGRSGPCGTRALSGRRAAGAAASAAAAGSPRTASRSGSR